MRMKLRRLQVDEETYRNVRIHAANRGLTIQKAVSELTNNSKIWNGVNKVEKQSKKIKFAY